MGSEAAVPVFPAVPAVFVTWPVPAVFATPVPAVFATPVPVVFATPVPTRPVKPSANWATRESASRIQLTSVPSPAAIDLRVRSIPASVNNGLLMIFVEDSDSCLWDGTAVLGFIVIVRTILDCN